MLGHVGVGPVHRRLVEAGPGDAGLQIVGDDLRRHPAEAGEGPASARRSSPTAPGSRSPRRRSGSRRRAPPRTAAPRRTSPVAGVDDLQRGAGIVDEHPLAGDMMLAHHRRQPPVPAAIELAKPAVAITRRDERRGIPPRAATASRPGAAARGGSPANPAGPRRGVLGPPIGWNSSASSAASVMSDGSGQVSPACCTRFRYSLAVLCPTPRLAAIFRVDSPLAWSRKASLIFRIVSLFMGPSALLKRAGIARHGTAQQRQILTRTG